jgi:hypothetical protein
MMRSLIIAFALTFACSSGPSALEGQTVVDNGIDDRIEAINAMLASRVDIVADSTLIAACSVPRDSSATSRGLDSRFVRLLVAGDSALSKMGKCVPEAFARLKHRVLFLESIRVERDSSAAFQPEFRRHHAYVRLQVLESASYREHQEYHVQPRGLSVNGSGATTLASWRVVDYKLVGWDFHWGDNVGHGSGVRRPPF